MRFSLPATLAAELSEIAGHDDVAVYGIGRELPFTMSAWSDKMSLEFPLLSDPTLVVAQASPAKDCEADGHGWRAYSVSNIHTLTSPC